MFSNEEIMDKEPGPGLVVGVIYLPGILIPVLLIQQVGSKTQAINLTEIMNFPGNCFLLLRVI